MIFRVNHLAGPKNSPKPNWSGSIFSSQKAPLEEYKCSEKMQRKTITCKRLQKSHAMAGYLKVKPPSPKQTT